MYSNALPKEGDYKEVQSLVRHSEAAAIITSLRAENERLNTLLALSRNVCND